MHVVLQFERREMQLDSFWLASLSTTTTFFIAAGMKKGHGLLFKYILSWY